MRWERFCLLVHTDITMFTITHWVALPDTLVSVCLRVNFPAASEWTKTTRECKGSWEGQDVDEKGMLCVCPSFPRAELQDEAEGLMGNARGFDSMLDAHNTRIVQVHEQFLNQAPFIVRHCSLLILRVCLSSLSLFLTFFLSFFPSLFLSFLVKSLFWCWWGTSRGVFWLLRALICGLIIAWLHIPSSVGPPETHTICTHTNFFPCCIFIHMWHLSSMTFSCVFPVHSYSLSQAAEWCLPKSLNGAGGSRTRIHQVDYRIQLLGHFSGVWYRLS